MCGCAVVTPPPPNTHTHAQKKQAKHLLIITPKPKTQPKTQNKGAVKISSKRIAQLIGQVFLQRSAVNLLSTVLDTPEFFWSAPDHLQVAVGVCVRVSCVCVLTLVGAWGGRRCLLAFSWLLCRFPQFHKHTPKKQNTPHKHNTTNNTNPKTLYERACEYLELETRGELSWAEFVCGGG